MTFGGETFDQGRDGDRLARQLKAVRKVMGDNLWHTLYGVSERTGAPQASVSARLRDLRKPQFGGHTIERRYFAHGVWEYRMKQPETGENE